MLRLTPHANAQDYRHPTVARPVPGGALQRVLHDAEQEESDAAAHHGEGRVEKIDRETVTLSHGPIASMQWGAMTMDFKLPKAGAPSAVREGAMVDFDFKATPSGEYEITAIAPQKAQTQGARK